MLHKVDFSLKNRVVWIGSLHGVLLIYGLFHAIYNIIDEERPITDGDIFNIAIHLSFHAFLISTLILGAKTESRLLLLPWLIVTFPVFVTVSYYVLKYSRSSYVSQFVFNIFFICSGWYFWITVFRFCKSCKNLNRRLGEKT